MIRTSGRFVGRVMKILSAKLSALMIRAPLRVTSQSAADEKRRWRLEDGKWRQADRALSFSILHFRFCAARKALSAVFSSLTHQEKKCARVEKKIDSLFPHLYIWGSRKEVKRHGS